jgi:nucleoside 2-deoxyribosyltransferase
MSWDEELSPKDRREWDRWVAHVREGTLKAMAESAFVASLVPSGETDIKFAVELGLAIMLGKPIVAIALHGQVVPPKLREVADAVIEVSDMDTEAGQAELHAKLGPVIKRLTAAGN